jgi:hypothetical protein
VTTRRRVLLLGAGVFGANLAGVAAIAVAAAISRLLASVQGNAHYLADNVWFAIVLPGLFLGPIGMGVLAAYIWRALELRIPHLLALSLAVTGVGVLGAYAIFGEGYLCLLIASPLLWLLVFTGMLIGARAFRSNKTALHAVVLPLVFVAMVGDAHYHASRRGVVVDEMLVRADAAAVWRHVVAFPEITAPPTYWLNHIGLPMPTGTTCAGEFVGADRACIFSNGLVFKERISELVPERLLTFDIVEQPRDPELLGHLDLHRGQFELRPNSDGTTTLIGRSWYTLHVRPHWYFDWWTRDITREVHLRVMRHIKSLAETGQ